MESNMLDGIVIKNTQRLAFIIDVARSDYESDMMERVFYDFSLIADIVTIQIAMIRNLLKSRLPKQLIQKTVGNYIAEVMNMLREVFPEYYTDDAGSRESEVTREMLNNLNEAQNRVLALCETTEPENTLCNTITPTGEDEDVEELSYAKEFAYMELLVAFGYNPQQYLNTILQQVEIIKNTLNTYLPDEFIKTIVRDYANNSHSIICDYFRDYLQRHSARKKCNFLINGVCICVLIKNADKKLREMGAEDD